MRAIVCKTCPAEFQRSGPCTIRKGKSREGDIVTLFETIQHANKQKEKRVYGRFNEKTNEILDLIF